MKKIIIYLLSIVIFWSCDETFDDYSENPNSPEKVTPALLLSATQVATFATYTGQMARLSNIFTQHCAGTVEGSQYLQFANYDIKEGDITNEWSGIYTDILINAKYLETEFGTANPYYAGMSKIIQAFALGVATDFWGDIPYSKGLNGLSAEFNPGYDTQETIISTIKSLCDAGVTELNKEVSANVNVPGADDLIYGGDVKKWIKAAYMLKARYAIRLTEIAGATTAANEALGYLTSAGLTGNSDDFNAVFPDAGGNSRNQWADFQNQRGNYMKMGAFFINQMTSTSDPRLSFFATKDSKGGYSGNAATDQNTTTTSNVGTAIASNTQTLGMLTYVEAKFIEAEAKLRIGDATAGAAFKAAVSASVEKVTGEKNDDFVNAVTATVDLENIMLQKYVALFASIEPYNDYRRTGFPALTPNSSAVVNIIPLRLPSSSDERIYNTNATIVSDVKQPVWWDK